MLMSEEKTVKKRNSKTRQRSSRVPTIPWKLFKISPTNGKSDETGLESPIEIDEVHSSFPERRQLTRDIDLFPHMRNVARQTIITTRRWTVETLPG
jgi:hypothetical protein